MKWLPVALQSAGACLMSASGVQTSGTINLASGTYVTGTLANANTTASASAGNSTIVARNGSGDFAAGVITAALTGNVTGNVSGSSGSTTGNAATATALAADPADCGAGTKAISIAASGALTCSAVSLTADVSGTLPNANTTASASAGNSTIIARDGSGNFAAGTITAALTGNASTATALAADPADCGAGTKAVSIAASGALTCSAVSLTADVSGVLPLANGGSNKNMTAVEGGLVWTDADSQEVSAAGTSGRAVISGGTGAPTFFAPTLGSVIFAGASGILQQDNTGLFFDDTNNRLGVMNAAPVGRLQVTDTVDAGWPNGLVINNSVGGANALWSMYVDSSNYFRIYNPNQVIGVFMADATGRVGLAAGSYATGGAVNIIGNTTTIPSLYVKAAGGQATDLQDWVDSSNNIIAKVDINGGASVQKLNVGAFATHGGVLAYSTSTGDFRGSVVAVPACSAVSASNIDWSLGNCFTKTLSANTVFTFTNRQPGQTIVLRTTSTPAAAFTVTFPNTNSAGNSVLWSGSTIPTSSTSGKRDIWTVFFDGTEMYGNATQAF